jgi:hypothetical protein
MALDYFLNRANNSPRLTTIEWERLRRDSRVPEEKVCGVFEVLSERLREKHPSEYEMVDAITMKKMGRKIYNGSEGTMF